MRIAFLLATALWLFLSPFLASAAPAPARRVTFDRHSILIDGRPTLLWSGEFHAFRLPSPDLWRDILQKMKAGGFNTVAVYFDWGFHSPKRGVYDFTGIRDLDRLLDMAKEEGLYVITRAGPYINAEVTRGGFPAWLVNQSARARTDDPEYLAAADEWLTRVNAIVARHQLDDGRGTVVLHQIENELALTTPAQARYMRHLYDKARADGITVPIFHNDQGRNGYWVPQSSGVAGTVEGPVDLYAFDGYPGATCTVANTPTRGPAAPDWGLYGVGGARGGASASPKTPGFIAEFGGGWFDYWGSNGMYPCNAIQRGVGYQRVFYGTNIANGIAIQSIYMTYGGTSWGWLPAPVVYSSYDYGAAIAEARNLRPKALELKQIGQFVNAVPDLARLERAPAVAVSSPRIQVYHDRNPDTDARLLFVAHKPSSGTGDERFTITADLPDGRYTLGAETPMRLVGQDARLLLAGVDLERQRLVYSTSEVQTSLRGTAQDVVLLYGRGGDTGETVLRYRGQPEVTVIEGNVASRWDAARGDLRLDYLHRGLARVRIAGGGRAPLLLLIGDVAAAERFFRTDAALVSGPALVRRAVPRGGTIDLTGDTAAAEPLEIWTAAPVGRVRWNGETVATRRSESDSLVARAPLRGPGAIALPDLTRARWRRAAGTPEARPGFDDRGWTVASGARNSSTIRPPGGQPTLSMDAYGFHDGDVWYRGRFAGSDDAQRIALHYGAGGAGMLQVWLDGNLVGQHELPAGLPRPITTGVAEFALPAAARTPGEHVLSVMVRNNGHNWDLDSDDFHKEARGLISVSLSRPGGAAFAVPVAWRIQGRAGGEDLVDVARGQPNNGGQYGERMGWHLPGFVDAGWQRVTVPAAADTDAAGTTWYRTAFDLAVPKGDDATIGIQIGDPSTPRSPGRYRALIFVNGWNMGQFVANIGPQRVFPVPEGILNHRGRNVVALAVTGDGTPGNALEAVRLVTLHHVRGGVPVAPVAAPRDAGSGAMIDLNRRQTLAGAIAATALPVLPAQAVQGAATGPADPLTLWYRQPAQEWVEALPLGNGRLGAMVFGGVSTERIQLNEDSFFAGGPYDANNPAAAAALPEVRRLIFAGDYAAAQKLADARMLAIPVKQMSYQPIGDLALFFPGIEGVRDYVRTLDLDGAIARTRFRVGGAWHVREVIASPVDQVVAVRLSGGGRRGFAVGVALATPQAATLSVEGDDIVMRGIGPARHGIPGAIRFETRVRVIPTGGTITRRSDGLFVDGATEMLLLIATATSYRAPDDVAGDPAALNAATLGAIGERTWDRILADHQADHRRLFRVMTLDLGTSDAAASPTDERVRRSGERADPALATLYHQFGRYLLIASSRAGGQPANLQGLWNEKTNPSWDSKWTLNINAQMNYWPADMTGLGPCVEPLLRMTQELAVTGRETARRMYGARGWVVHNNTDLFRQTAVVDGAKWALWPMGGAWLLQNLWDHWDYGRDRAFLSELYPLMTGACDFYLDTLQPHPVTGDLVTNPSLSPENAHPFGASLCAGPAMDSQLLRDLFTRTAEAARLLGRDADLRARWRATAARLPKDRIGKAGQLQEWMEDWDMAAPERHHRHVSHLYALYPSEQIDPQNTPALAAAAKRSLEIRGDAATGWGLGWRLNLWAKLGDGEHAHRVLGLLLDPSRTYPNLFDAHPPFQIDGNFGGTAGITQMLVQSHAGTIHLLPALPAAWPQGRVTGVCVRGAATVDLAWADGRLVEATLRSVPGGRFRIRAGDRTRVVTLPRNGARRLDGRLAYL